MGLALEVGMLADLLENDEEGAQWFQEDLDKLNPYLESIGLTKHEEPKNCKVYSWQMYGYSGLHYLRRIAAHLDLKDQLPSPGDSELIEDPLIEEYSQLAVSEPGILDRLLKKGKKKLNFDHLLLHSDAEGYYLPQDFEDVIFPPENLEISGGMIGSSKKLMDECEHLAEVLELNLEMDPEAEELWMAADSQGEGKTKWQKYGVESFSCLRLHHAAKLSIKTGAALVFC